MVARQPRQPDRCRSNLSHRFAALCRGSPDRPVLWMLNEIPREVSDDVAGWGCQLPITVGLGSPEAQGCDFCARCTLSAAGLVSDVRPSACLSHFRLADGTGGGREPRAALGGVKVVEMRGLEPLTPAMRTRCSPS